MIGVLYRTKLHTHILSGKGGKRESSMGNSLPNSILGICQPVAFIALVVVIAVVTYAAGY
jgi:hypothetical protein